MAILAMATLTLTPPRSRRAARRACLPLQRMASSRVRGRLRRPSTSSPTRRSSSRSLTLTLTLTLTLSPNPDPDPNPDLDPHPTLTLTLILPLTLTLTLTPEPYPKQVELVVTTNTVPNVATTLPPAHPVRRKLVILSVAPIIAHHMAGLAGLPPPEVDPSAPVYSMHGLLSG